MPSRIQSATIGGLGLVAALGLLAAWQADSVWTERFPVERGDLASTGQNPYFVLEPGYRLVLEGAASD